VLEATKAGLQVVKRDMQEQEGRELMVQQDAVENKELCPKFQIQLCKEMADQLLHEQLQQTNKYKEMCAHMLHQENALLKEIGEIFDHELIDLVLNW
jgi:hypothetical protein